MRKVDTYEVDTSAGIHASSTGTVESDTWTVTSRKGIMFKRAVFLDLNGTLVTPILVNHPRELTTINGASEAVGRLCQAGFTCPVVTVQSRIEKGLFTEADFLQWFGAFKRQMAERGAMLEGPYVCPHRPRSRCACAKPNTTLYERAAADFNINLRDSFVIGDTDSDVEAARRFGGKGYLVGTDATLRDAVDAILF